MKQYTDKIQTAKLIELGFEKPKGGISKRVSYFDDRLNRKCRYEISEFNYSIGELIEMLGVHLSSIYYIGIEWFVNAEGIECRRAELIEALYYMCIKLREEGVI